MSVEIRTGRWQETLIGEYDPERAAVITDPPYGLGVAGAKGYGDAIPWAEHVAEILATLPAKRYAIRGPATALVRRDYPEPRRICVEIASFRRRAAVRNGVVPYLWQGWAIYGRLRVERHARFPSGDARTVNALADDDSGPKTQHRALTPIEAALWIVETWTDPGMVVVDPFAGHGTIGRAAQTYGFDYLGAEVDPVFAGVAKAGLAIERPTLGLAR